MAIFRPIPLPETRLARAPAGGFTLIELLVTISIAVILMTVAIPSFTNFIRDNRLTTQSNDLVLALAYARSEAVKRGLQVSVCARATDSTCTSSGTSWDAGWLTFVDNNPSDNTITVDVVLRIRGPLEGGNTLRGNGSLRRVTYASTGYSANAGTLTFCDSRGAADAAAVVVSQTGRARVAEDSDGDGTVEDGSDNNVTCP